MHRLKGELLLREDHSNAAEAPSCLLRVARNSSDLALYLRARSIGTFDFEQRKGCRRLAFDGSVCTASTISAGALTHDFCYRVGAGCLT
jgi:hypothetical protein